MTDVVKVVDVTKNFGHIKALRGISLNFTKGEKTSFLGPNGAGKSTLLRIIATQMVPSSGEVLVMGENAHSNREKAKRSIGVVGHRSFLYDELTVLENLKFYGSFLDVAESEFDRVLKITDIERWKDTKTGHLSYGLRKRGDISRALLGDPAILLLDEFFAGLDQATSGALVTYMEGLKDQTIITTSHTPELINSFCHRPIHIRRGLIEKDVQLR
ncbi:ABC transporter ATP-binding protein [Candidatus Bathyarchaeota archaeon]|nr:ABC transporter ATP-binding protein [Candidatus Bathyarchaeota archaeon]